MKKIPGSIICFFAVFLLFALVQSGCSDDDNSTTCPGSGVETCDGKDNDCDGFTDTDSDGNLLERSCEVGTEGCTGNETCANGAWTGCDVPPNTISNKSIEECNGYDDNCNGHVDEGLTESCSNNCGEGQKVCEGGQWSSCSAPTASAEQCNGKDDDCDGFIDENDEGDPLSEACTIGGAKGTKKCENGAWIACNTTELCNEKDDDGDGEIDEGVECDCTLADGTPEDCGKEHHGVGECLQGTRKCVEGKWTDSTCIVPVDETCDNKDNDCDGTTDNGNLSIGCETLCGVGIKECVDGVLSECTANIPTDEICDFVDNDCDGLTDESEDLDSDTHENNNVCAQKRGLGQLDEYVEDFTWKGSLFPDNDIDWYETFMVEASHFTFCLENPLGEQQFQGIVELRNIPEGHDYNFCIYYDFSECYEDNLWPADRTICTQMPTESDADVSKRSLGFLFNGRCGLDDNRNLFIKVFSSNNSYICHEYEMEAIFYQIDEKEE